MTLRFELSWSQLESSVGFRVSESGWPLPCGNWVLWHWCTRESYLLQQVNKLFVYFIIFFLLVSLSIVSHQIMSKKKKKKKEHNTDQYQCRVPSSSPLLYFFCLANRFPIAANRFLIAANQFPIAANHAEITDFHHQYHVPLTRSSSSFIVIAKKWFGLKNRKVVQLYCKHIARQGPRMKIAEAKRLLAMIHLRRWARWRQPRKL